MRKEQSASQPVSISFPDRRKSQALQEEDAFLEAHGQQGNRLIYLIVDALFRLCRMDNRSA